MGMRKGTQDVTVYVEDGVFVGVCLGWDFCSEHEWGIKKIKEGLGLKDDPKVFGPKRRQITKKPNFMFLKEHNDRTYLIYRSWSENKDFLHSEKMELNAATAEDARDWQAKYKESVWAPPTNGGAWNEETFGFVTSEEDVKSYLQELYDAFQRKDVLVYLGGKTNAFGNAGLCLVIASRFPKKYADDMRATDEDQYKLQKEADKIQKQTKLKQRLKDAGKGWFALRPAWSSSIKSTKDGEIKTKHPVIYFLNPKAQNENNVGWYTVEDLELWIEGKGPIPRLSTTKGKENT